MPRRTAQLTLVGLLVFAAQAPAHERPPDGKELKAPTYESDAQEKYRIEKV